MSKVLSVENGNYIVRVESGKNIILDTSRGQVDNDQNLLGEVIINGGLQVRGTTVTVNSEDLNVKDPVIILNKYDENTNYYGIIGGEAGIEIDRGTNVPVRMIFKDNISWQRGPSSGTGTFTFQDDNYNFPLPLHIGGVVTDGTFYVDCEPGVISVTNTSNYEQRIFTYQGVGESLEIIALENDGIVDDDYIPNARAVVDYVKYALTNIGTGSTIGSGNSTVTIYDDSLNPPSRLVATIDGIEKFVINNTETTIENIKIDSNTISPTDIDVDLILQAPGVASVKINDVLEITETPHANDIKIDPFAPTDSVKIYCKDPGPGNTGLYYINKNEINDEIISKNRALLYGMIF